MSVSHNTASADAFMRGFTNSPCTAADVPIGQADPNGCIWGADHEVRRSYPSLLTLSSRDGYITNKSVNEPRSNSRWTSDVRPQSASLQFVSSANLPAKS